MSDMQIRMPQMGLGQVVHETDREVTDFLILQVSIRIFIGGVSCHREGWLSVSKLREGDPAMPRGFDTPKEQLEAGFDCYIERMERERERHAAQMQDANQKDHPTKRCEGD